jgi:hypothetical protein
MMNWKECGRKRLWPNFEALFQNFSRVTEKKHKKSQDSRFPGQDVILGLPEYEAGVLTTRPYVG